MNEIQCSFCRDAPSTTVVDLKGSSHPACSECAGSSPSKAVTPPETVLEIATALLEEVKAGKVEAIAVARTAPEGTLSTDFGWDRTNATHLLGGVTLLGHRLARYLSDED